MLDVVSVEIDCPENRHDILVAELAPLGFHAFVRERDATLGWIDASLWERGLEESTRAVCTNVGADFGAATRVAAQNWNARWEATVRPIRVPPFLVRPSWAEKDDALHDILIDPKMSFGTGHHETTRLMLGYISEYVGGGTHVLDLGTGTGVLAIAAARVGASEVRAVDNDPWSVANALENIAANEVDGVVVVEEGTLASVSGTFDVILANINTGVLLAIIPELSARLRSRGIIVMSGMLERDVPSIAASLESHGFVVARRAGEGEWWSVAARLG